MAGNKVRADDLVSIILTCKYMGWDLQTYNSQPLYFIQAIDIMRRIEGEETERLSKKAK